MARNPGRFTAITKIFFRVFPGFTKEVFDVDVIAKLNLDGLPPVPFGLALIAVGLVLAVICWIEWRDAPEAETSRGYWSWQRTPTMARITSISFGLTALIPVGAGVLTIFGFHIFK